MKTLDEALDVIMMKKKTKKEKARIESEFYKFAPTMEEILRNDRITAIGEATILSVTIMMIKDGSIVDKPPETLPMELWRQGFIDGVKIGMEMERSEKPGIVLE